MLCTPLAPTAADAAASLTDLLDAEVEAGPLPSPCACTNAAVQWMHEVRDGGGQGNTKKEAGARGGGGGGGGGGAKFGRSKVRGRHATAGDPPNRLARHPVTPPGGG